MYMTTSSVNKFNFFGEHLIARLAIVVPEAVVGRHWTISFIFLVTICIVDRALKSISVLTVLTSKNRYSGICLADNAKFFYAMMQRRKVLVKFKVAEKVSYFNFKDQGADFKNRFVLNDNLSRLTWNFNDTKKLLKSWE